MKKGKIKIIGYDISNGYLYINHNYNQFAIILSSVYLIIDKQKWLSYNIKNANTADEKMIEKNEYSFFMKNQNNYQTIISKKHK